MKHFVLITVEILVTSVLASSALAAGNCSEVFAKRALARELYGQLPSLYASKKPLALLIKTDLTDILAKREVNSSSEENPDAKHVWTEGFVSILEKAEDTNIQAKIRARGNTSNADTESAFPKLRIKLDKKRISAASDFDAATEFRVNTHVNSDPKSKWTPMGRLNNENSPLREGLAYELAAELGLLTPGTRQARVTYEDRKTHQSTTRNALLIETDSSILKRTLSQNVDPVAFSNDQATKIDPTDGAEFLLFQKMIGNNDVQLRVNEEPVGMTEVYRPLWNTSLLEFPGGVRKPLVYDLDMASFVTGRRPGLLNPNFGLNEKNQAGLMTSLAALASHFTKSQLKAAFTRLQTREKDLYALIKSAKVDDVGRKIALFHLDTFFKNVPLLLETPVTLDETTQLFADSGRSKSKLRINSLTGKPGVLHIGTLIKVLENGNGYLKVSIIDAHGDLLDGETSVGFVDANSPIGASVTEEKARFIEERDLTLPSGGE